MAGPHADHFDGEDKGDDQDQKSDERKDPSLPLLPTTLQATRQGRT
jgi:hypothetical protein